MGKYSDDLFQENKYLKRLTFWLEIGMIVSWLLFIAHVMIYG